jgi:DNA-binding NtrC family response regulator
MDEEQNSASRVLVVVGEAATRSFIKRTLESVLLDVEAVSQFGNAIMKVRSGGFGVVVVDPTESVRQGVDLLHQLHREDPSLARRTVVVIDPASSVNRQLDAFPSLRRIDRPVLRDQLILAISECLRDPGA